MARARAGRADGAPALRESDRLGDPRGAGARRGGLPRRGPGPAGARFAGVHPHRRTRPARRLATLVALAARRRLEASRGPGLDPARPRPASGGARRVGGCAGVRGLGRQAAALRARVGVRRTRRPGRRHLPVGERVPFQGPGAGEHVAGWVPVRAPGHASTAWAPRGSAPSHPMGTACSTSPATSGSGPRPAWTEDHAADGATHASHSCCTPAAALTEMDRKVIKGGSHLCAPTYCHRYRPAARQGHAVRSPTNHVGFRCVRDP